MSRKKPAAGEIYRHFRGKKYRILHLAVSTETKREMVVYEASDGDGKVYVSVLENFMGAVNREKYPDATQNDRFELVHEETDEALFEELDVVVEEDAEDYEEPEEADEQQEKVSKEHAMILEYLDLDTEEEKLQYLQKHRNELTDRFLTAAAESMDYAERGESQEERYAEIVRYLKTKMRYESGRRL